MATTALPPADNRPPMCRALTALREAKGISNAELARQMGIAQATSWRYEHDREPGYAETQRIEEVLELPAGTLFAAAGYTPTQDSVVAVELDPLLTASQKERVIFAIYMSGC